MEFKALVNHFALLRLNIVTRLNQPLHISGFAGDMLHNNWGRVLKSVDARLATAIYATDGEVKPFVITPAEPLRKDYQQGERFVFQLVLFNQCCSELPAILNAVHHWQNIGFIPDQQRCQGCMFTLETIDSVAPLMPVQRIYGFVHWGKLPQPFLLADALDGSLQNLAHAWHDDQTTLGAAITLQTPVRLTFENKQLRQAPSAAVWFNAIARRLWFLAAAANLVIDDVNHRDEYYYSLTTPTDPQNAGIRLINHHSEFVDLRRYSAKQHSSQNLGGLLGDFRYLPLDIHHLALLEVGQYLKIGNKTTFGFGAYQWQLLVE